MEVSKKCNKPELSAGTLPRPDRTGCPPVEEVTMAASTQSVHGALREHLNECRHCFEEYRDAQKKLEYDQFFRRSSWGLYFVLFAIACHLIIKSCHAHG